MAKSGNRMFHMGVAWVVLMALGGCSKSFTARHYPAFYDPQLRTVAVVPFKNETNVPGAGTMAAEDVARALRANGTYRVVPPRRLHSLMAQKKIESLSRTDQQKDAEQFRSLGGVDAFVTGTLLSDSAIGEVYGDGNEYPTSYMDGSRARYQLVDEDESGNEEGGDEDFGDDFGEDFGEDYFYGPYYPYGYRGWPYYYPEYNSQAHVSLDASLVRVSDGEVLYHTPVPVQSHADLSSYREVAPGVATIEAMNRASTKLVRDLAVVPVEVKVNPATDLRTAVGGEDGHWTYRNRFSPGDDTMYVVIQLAPSVARDSFRLTVTRRGEPGEVVLAKDFKWPAGQTVDAVTLSPTEITNRAGVGRYIVSLHAMGQAVMRHDFTIK